MKKFILPLMILLIANTSLLSQINVVYPNINGLGEDSFGFAALKLALEKSGVSYTLRLDPEEMTNERIRERMLNGQISVADFGTSPDFEEQFLPIYIPIDLGLNGWRLMAIRKERAADFAAIDNLDKLKGLTAGQGKGWSDTAILRASDLNVIEGPQIGNLFKMVNAGRFDYFPLGANEIHSLIQTYRDLGPDIIVEETLVLIYPFGRLFFVNRENEPLAVAIYKGLVIALSDGSFMELFSNHSSNRNLFLKANLQSRTRIYLENPYMTERFKSIPREYFFESYQQ